MTLKEFNLLRLHAIPGIRWSKLNKIIRTMQEMGMDFEDFLHTEQDLWKEKFGFTLPTKIYIENNIDKINKTAFRWQVQLTPMSVKIIECTSPRFPKMLIEFFDVPPPVLYLSGNWHIIDSYPKIALINSRSLSTKGSELLNRILRSINKPITMVTSFYKVTYRRVAEMAIEKDLPLILVSDRGLLQTKKSKLFKKIHKKTLVLSPFAPDDVGTASSGPRRDAIIVALSDIIVGLEIRQGGTMERMLSRAITKKKTVWVYKPKYITSNTTGNWRLIELGAKPFDDEKNVMIGTLSSF